MKRIILTALVFSLLISALAGCTGSQVRTYTDPTATPSAEAADDTSQETATPDAQAEETPDYDYAYEKYEPDTVVMTVDGQPVYWEEYFYWLTDAMYLVEYYYGTITDWDAACEFVTTMTYAEYVKEYADGTARMYHSMENKAEELGITLTDEDNEYIDSLWQSDIDSVGSEEELIEQIETVYLTKDLYYYINTVSVLADAAFTELYGETGEKLDDEEVISYAEDSGYMRAKHILFMTVDEEGNALPDEEIEAQEQAAQEVLAQLRQAQENGEDTETLFDELMNEYSEDTGLTAYPDGYCFICGDMVEEFSTAAEALGEYEISDVVTSDYGYHIILRLPLRADDIPINDGTNSLRILAASDMFNASVSNWSEEAELVWSEGFEELTPADIFDEIG